MRGTCGALIRKTTPGLLSEAPVSTQVQREPNGLKTMTALSGESFAVCYFSVRSTLEKREKKPKSQTFPKLLLLKKIKIKIKHLFPVCRDHPQECFL